MGFRAGGQADGAVPPVAAEGIGPIGSVPHRSRIIRGNTLIGAQGWCVKEGGPAVSRDATSCPQPPDQRNGTSYDGAFADSGAARVAHGALIVRRHQLLVKPAPSGSSRWPVAFSNTRHRKSTPCAKTLLHGGPPYNRSYGHPTLQGKPEFPRKARATSLCRVSILKFGTSRARNSRYISLPQPTS